MTTAELIEEGRRLRRPAVLLEPAERGEVAAYWYGLDREDAWPEGMRLWVAVKAACIPDSTADGWLSVLTDEESCVGGRIERSPSPPAEGLPLYARAIDVIPPIDAVFARGSAAVETWLAANSWQREWRYNANFRDRAIVDAYLEVEGRENPLYWRDAYASLGGWHLGWPEDDFYDLIDERLLVHTYRESEPWVEAWQLHSGDFKVIQRIT